MAGCPCSRAACAVRRRASAAVLQPFVPLLVCWAGRGEAPRLTGAEIHHAQRVGEPLPHGHLMSAWYLSELVLTLTARHDPQPELYGHYTEALAGLRSPAAQERTLRLFEKRLLDTLGYGVADLDEAPSTIRWNWRSCAWRCARAWRAAWRARLLHTHGGGIAGGFRAHSRRRELG